MAERQVEEDSTEARAEHESDLHHQDEEWTGIQRLGLHQDGPRPRHPHPHQNRLLICAKLLRSNELTLTLLTHRHLSVSGAASSFYRQQFHYCEDL